MPDSKELVGGNINEGGNVNDNGRDKAFVKVMAGMLPNVAFDELWNRYEHDKAEKERKEREEREKFLRIQSRLVGEKAINIQNNTSLAQRIASSQSTEASSRLPALRYMVCRMERMLRWCLILVVVFLLLLFYCMLFLNIVRSSSVS